jgi:ATP-dependent DNA helicase Q5
VLPTGFGKSFIYQSAAVCSRGVTVVVTPLLALAEDQVRSLDDRGIAAALLTSSMRAERKQQLLDDLEAEDGEPETRLLYLTPEGLHLPATAAVLRRLHVRGRLAAIVVDEAHCVSQWGHSFRPEYLRVGELRKALPPPVPPLVALTATATPRVRDDLIRQLGMRSPKVLSASADRPNLFWEVAVSVPRRTHARHVQRGPSAAAAAAAGAAADGSMEEKEEEEEEEEEEEALGAWVEAQEGSGIVYCSRRAETERVAALLCERGIDAEAFHAGLALERRQRVSADWMVDSTRVIVSTLAFGMGVDKAAVRFVAHWDPPKTMEGLLQEAGRAGRDGRPAVSRVFYSRSRLPPVGSELAPNASVVRYAEAQLTAEAAATCRRAMLLRHFGEVPLAMAGRGCEVDGCEVDGAWRCCDLCECRARLLASGLLPTAPTTTVTATAPTTTAALVASGAGGSTGGDPSPARWARLGAVRRPGALSSRGARMTAAAKASGPASHAVLSVVLSAPAASPSPPLPSPANTCSSAAAAASQLPQVLARGPLHRATVPAWAKRACGGGLSGGNRCIGTDASSAHGGRGGRGSRGSPGIADGTSDGPATVTAAHASGLPAAATAPPRSHASQASSSSSSSSSMSSSHSASHTTTSRSSASAFRAPRRVDPQPCLQERNRIGLAANDAYLRSVISFTPRPGARTNLGLLSKRTAGAAILVEKGAAGRGGGGGGLLIDALGRVRTGAANDSDDEEAADPEHDVEMATGSCHEGACGGDDDDGSGIRPFRRRPLEDVPHRDAANNRAAKVPRVGAL